MSTPTDIAIARQREAEQNFAGAVLYNPADALTRCGWLKPEMIIDECVKEFWTHFINGSNGNPIDAATRAHCLPQLTEWENRLPPTASMYPEKLADEITRMHFWIKIDPLISDLLKAREAMDFATIHQIVAKLSGSAPQQRVEIPDAMDASLRFIEWLESDIKSIETFVPKIDRALAGMDYQALTILAARPSMGKSTLAAQIARNVAKTRRVTVFTNEMSLLAWWRKAICGIAEVDYRDIKAGRLTIEQKERLKDIALETAEQYEDRLRIDDRTHHTTETIWQMVAAQHPDLVIVDILANVQDRHEREVLRLGQIIRNLRNMAKETYCHVIVVHHVNRETEHQTNKRPTMANLRESGELEQTADNVLFLHSEDYYETGKKLPDNIPVELWVAKNREGPRQICINMLYDTKHQWFKDE